MRTWILNITCLLSWGHVASAQGRLTEPFTEGWSFIKGTFASPKAAAASSGWESVSIPHTWNNVDMQSGPNYYKGDAWYRKSWTPEANIKDKRVFLRFEGVGQVADLYVNNQWVGQHKGAFGAFCFEITHFLKADTVNLILVKANNEERKDIIPINNRLFGVYGGMYRPVALIITPKVNISTLDYASPGVYIRQDSVSAEAADITVTTKIENTEAHPVQRSIQTEVRDSTGRMVVSDRQNVWLQDQGMNNIIQRLHIRQPHLWNGRKDPYLYAVRVSLRASEGKASGPDASASGPDASATGPDGSATGSADLDAVVQPLGLRNFSIVQGKGFYLNGQPYRLYGVNRHQEWEGSGSALSNAQHKQDLDLIKEIGATSIRFAHYQQAEYIYSSCDSMGFVIWAEIPFVNAWSGQEAENARQQLTELIRQNYNHPSIYVWGMHNEVYSKTADGYVPTVTRMLNDLAKTEDPGRWTVSTSGYGELDRPSNHQADIQAMNRYYGWYEGHTHELEGWVSGLEQQYPEARVVLSEYGCEANIHQQTEMVADTGNPSGQFWPETYQTAFHETQWGIIEKHPYLLATYVWNMFDFCVPGAHGGGVAARNLKGLVTYDRKVRKDAFWWYKANWSSDPVLYIAGRRDSIREKSITTVKVFAHMDQVTLKVNGKPLPAPHQGSTKADYVFEHVHLKKGKNIIEATGVYQGLTYHDSITWVLPPHSSGATSAMDMEKVHL
jgi:beta-galactosidase